MTRSRIEMAMVLFVCAALVGSATAAITPSGDVTITPTDAHWFIGDSSTGSVTVDGGSTLDHGANGVYFLRLGDDSGSSGSLTISGAGSTVNNKGRLRVGSLGNGTLLVEAGGQLNTCWGNTVSNDDYTIIGYGSGTSSSATVTGTDSKWTDSSTQFRLGQVGQGSLTVSAGGEMLVNNDAVMGYNTSTVSQATVTGSGSLFKILDTLSLNLNHQSPSVTLTIEDGGLVQAHTMSIEEDEVLAGTAEVKMQTGGMLALSGSASDLAGFTGLITGYDANDILYYNGSAWDSIENATVGVDYTITAGVDDLAGYTVLTVPEPATLGLLGMGGLTLLRRKR